MQMWYKQSPWERTANLTRVTCGPSHSAAIGVCVRARLTTSDLESGFLCPEGEGFRARLKGEVVDVQHNTASSFSVGRHLRTSWVCGIRDSGEDYSWLACNVNRYRARCQEVIAMKLDRFANALQLGAEGDRVCVDGQLGGVDVEVRVQKAGGVSS